MSRERAGARRPSGEPWNTQSLSNLSRRSADEWMTNQGRDVVASLGHDHFDGAREADEAGVEEKVDFLQWIWGREDVDVSDSMVDCVWFDIGR